MAESEMTLSTISSQNNQKLTKVVVVTVILSEKLEYKPEIWEEFQKALGTCLSRAAMDNPNVIIGLNFQTNSKRVKTSQYDLVDNSFWKNV